MRVSRDRLVSLFLLGTLAGVVLSWACGPFPPEANAASGDDCARWEVAVFQLDDPEEAGAVTLPAGWEPDGGAGPQLMSGGGLQPNNRRTSRG